VQRIMEASRRQPRFRASPVAYVRIMASNQEAASASSTLEPGIKVLAACFIRCLPHQLQSATSRPGDLFQDPSVIKLHFLSTAAERLGREDGCLTPKLSMSRPHILSYMVPYCWASGIIPCLIFVRMYRSLDKKYMRIAAHHVRRRSPAGLIALPW
jgi:hypothetical protein